MPNTNVTDTAVSARLSTVFQHASIVYKNLEDRLITAAQARTKLRSLNGLHGVALNTDLAYLDRIYKTALAKEVVADLIDPPQEEEDPDYESSDGYEASDE